MYEYINGNERDYENFGARRARNRVMVEKIWASKVLWANWSFQGGCRGIFGIYSVWRALVRKDRGICGNWTIYRGLNEVLSGLGQFCN
jgi:hypothetical protein